jgi:hypothetical protein
MRFAIAVVSTTILAACSDSTVGPKEGAASMRLSASAMTATALGQNVTIQASIVDAGGSVMTNEPIRWELGSADVLEALDSGKFRVLKEGSVRVTAVWPKDPSVMAAVTVNVDAGLMTSACISRTDQAAAGAGRKCAQQRVVVRTADLRP